MRNYLQLFPSLGNYSEGSPQGAPAYNARMVCRRGLVSSCFCLPLAAMALLALPAVLVAQESFDGRLKTETVSGDVLRATAPHASFYYDTAADKSLWGDLVLRLVYDGDPPKPKKLPIGGGVVMDSEQLLVNAKDRGVANMVIWLDRKPGQPPLRVHPSYAESAKAKVELATKGNAFVPHVALARTNQPIVISNADPHGCNVKAELFNNQSFNVLLKPGDTWDLNFQGRETTPTRLEDSCHSWMTGYLLVCDDPYAAISDQSGKLRIKDLPVGEWTFVVWHESGTMRKANLAGKDVEWQRGRVMLEIKPGENDLGEVKLPPGNFRH